MIMRMVIELLDGRKVQGFFFSTLASADKTKKISLIFDTMEIYTGFLKEIDDNGLIHLMNPGAIVGIVLPMDRLLYWFYAVN